MAATGHGLEPVNEHTISSREKLFEELRTIRERGVAYDTQERVEGMNCVAAPVTLEDRLYAAVSVTGPVSRVPMARMESELKELVQRTANVTEINLTYR
ncbi:IclR family transcriptional regulator C-terminal domain-containing protein [Haloarculaceae archaeon H-GB2-1]|nr:IclR family transcriptional regulator C-terminal domain-containing protein [Haloarculaceae archaeon H-GB1-1]MEA5388028.1 IclR family transcriptional regulator C-terminal domain-containing protein [Haloarculaceae archaeon H-GB11]MEA5409516.1 IclR family transcriptional regulator C-terminal domain-containing protein [Haloarculaceae archaeon H-GB2-1]